MDYERGLEQFIYQARNIEWFIEATLYQARLLDNLKEERLYGTTEQGRASRAQIIHQLTRLALEHLSVSFVDLCSNKYSNQYMEVIHQSDVLEEPEGSNVLLEHVPVPQRIVKDMHPSSPARIFVGYSYKDRQYVEELRVHLADEIRTGKAVCWDDTKILPEAVWRAEMRKALQAANRAILLISADFLTSNFIMNDELPQLLASAKSGKMMIMSVIVRPCRFKNTELAQFQTVNSPSEPLSTMSPSKRDKIWIEAVEYVTMASERG